MNDQVTPEILIVGRSSAGELSGLNALFQSLGYKCAVTEQPDRYTPSTSRQPSFSSAGENPSQTHMILIHWPTREDITRNSEGNALDIMLSDIRASFTGRHRIALIGCERDRQLETGALRAGADGVFFIGERPDVIIKGVTAIFKGELWYSRAILGEVIRSLRHKNSPGAPEVNGNGSRALKSLTRREKAVIKLLTLGARNKEIADELNISTHTVKAHVYSIFKKTNSRNRVEVINWAHQYQRYLSP